MKRLWFLLTVIVAISFASADDESHRISALASPSRGSGIKNCTTQATGRPMYYVLGLSRCPNSPSWTIHGLWPTCSVSKSPSFCGGPRYDASKLPLSLRQEMRSAWPSCAPMNDDTFHAHEWQKHGTCSGLSQSDYFWLALCVKKNMNVNPSAYDECRNSNSCKIPFAYGLPAACARLPSQSANRPSANPSPSDRLACDIQGTTVSQLKPVTMTVSDIVYGRKEASLWVVDLCRATQVAPSHTNVCPHSRPSFILAFTYGSSGITPLHCSHAWNQQLGYRVVDGDWTATFGSTVGSGSVTVVGKCGLGSDVSVVSDSFKATNTLKHSFILRSKAFCLQDENPHPQHDDDRDVDMFIAGAVTAMVAMLVVFLIVMWCRRRSITAGHVRVDAEDDQPMDSIPVSTQADEPGDEQQQQC